MPDSAQMIIANRLHDGRTVFRAPNGSWVDAMAGGAVAHDAATAAKLLAAAELDVKHNLVVGPYLIDVAEVNGVTRPLSWREVIRVNGPTIDASRHAG